MGFGKFWKQSKAIAKPTFNGFPLIKKVFGEDTAMIPFIGSGYTAQQNLEMQREQQAYDRQMQERIFAREDSATQRRADDLRRSGMSPVLAAGSGASAGSIVNSRAPQRDDTSNALSGLIMLIMQTLKTNADISRTSVQKDLIQAQTENARATTPNIRANLPNILANLNNIKANTSSTYANANTRWNDLKISKDTFTNSNPGSLLNTMRNIQNILEHEYGDKAPKKPNQRKSSEPKGGFKTKPDWMNQGDWEFYKENRR